MLSVRQKEEEERISVSQASRYNDMASLKLLFNIKYKKSLVFIVSLQRKNNDHMKEGFQKRKRAIACVLAFRQQQQQQNISRKARNR